MQRRVPGECDAVLGAAGGAVDGQGVAVAGKRAGSDLHGGEIEIGIVQVGHACRRRQQYRGGILLVGGVRYHERGRVVHCRDADHGGRHVAVVRPVVDHDLDEAVFRGGIVAAVAVGNLP